jgi:hypothetical protein
VCILPTRKRAKLEAIYISEVKVRSAKPGENVLMKFNINVEDIQKGNKVMMIKLGVLHYVKVSYSSILVSEQGSCCRLS